MSSHLDAAPLLFALRHFYTHDPAAEQDAGHKTTRPMSGSTNTRKGQICSRTMFAETFFFIKVCVR